MSELKTCKICQNYIIEKEEDYYLVQYYHHGTFKGKEYFHKRCFDMKVSGESEMTQMKKKAIELMDKTSKMIEVNS